MATRRKFLRGAVVAVSGITAARAASGASSDASLIALCAEHGANRDAINFADELPDEWDHPLWAAYDRTRDGIGAAQPQTMEGVLAKARAAKAEAGGDNYPEGSPAADWAWDIVNDLLRLHGGA